MGLFRWASEKLGNREDRKDDVTGETRSKLSNAVYRKSPENQDILDHFWEQFNSLHSEIKKSWTWEQVSVLPVNISKFPKAFLMQGGGQIFDIRPDGEMLMKDKGSNPVMYGWNGYDRRKREIIRIYNCERNQLRHVKEWASTSEIREIVKLEGYNLFKANSNGALSEEMVKAAAVNDDGFFVDETRSSVLLDHNWGDILFPHMYLIHGNQVSFTAPDHRSEDQGVIRWI